MISVLFLFLAALLAVVLFAAVRPPFRRVGTFLPDTFLLGLLLFASGSTYLAVAEPSVGSWRVGMMANLALASGGVGSLLWTLLSRRAYSQVDIRHQLAYPGVGPFDHAFVIGGLVLSVAVSLAFAYATLSNSVTGALLNLAALVYEGGLLDVRKALTSGEAGYFAPGYTKQFRDILAPTVLVAMSWGRFRRISRVRLVAIGVVSVSILLTGQRLPLVVFVAALILGRTLAVDRGWSLGSRLSSWAALGIIGAVTVAALSAVSFALGRVEPGTPFLLIPVETVGGLLERAVLTVPRENIETILVWGRMGPTGGASWLADLSAVLPGAAGETLSNILHMTAGGSAQGNVVLALATDTWLAWGWMGVLVVPFVFALSLGALDVMLVRSSSVSCLAARAYLWIVLPIMYSPYGFILYGGAFVIAVLVGHRVGRALSRLSRQIPRLTIERGLPLS